MSIAINMTEKHQEKRYMTSTYSTTLTDGFNFHYSVYKIQRYQICYIQQIKLSKYMKFTIINEMYEYVSRGKKNE